MAPAGKADLTKILTYHVVPGRLTAADLAAQAQANGGTVDADHGPGRDADGLGRPERLWVTHRRQGRQVDASPRPTWLQSNGVVHVIDTVVMPN